MDPDLEQISLAAFLLTFIAGIVTGFNPCCYAMLSAVMGLSLRLLRADNKTLRVDFVSLRSRTRNGDDSARSDCRFNRRFFRRHSSACKTRAGARANCNAAASARRYQSQTNKSAKMEAGRTGRGRRVSNRLDFFARRSAVRDARAGFRPFVRGC